MRYKKFAFAGLGFGSLFAVALLSACMQTGCGATCDRIEKDRETFLARKTNNNDTHIEISVPFALAERLVEPYVLKVNPIDVNVPGLGSVEKYFGRLSVAPVRVKLKKAGPGYIGFHLDFEVRSDGNRAFEMYVETEVRPEIDLKAGKITFGFTPEVLKKTKPGITSDAKKDLGGVIYSRIPSVAKLLVSRSMVDSAAGIAVDMLLDNFYEKAKDKMLPRLAKMSRFELAIPEVPLASVAIGSTDDGGGRLTLAIVTSLPVSAGISKEPQGAAKPSEKLISIRMSGSTVAELVNWAMAKGLVPDRYDDKGKAKKDGELRPGLDWIAGDDRPMKVYLWDLEKPCMRITMSAKPTVKIADESLEIVAADIKTDDVEASAFTKVGVWFHMLWKDALKLQKKASATAKVTVAGKKIEVIVDKTSIERDELALKVRLSVQGG